MLSRGRRGRQVHGSQPTAEPAHVLLTDKGRVHFVVVFNLTRFARDKCDHFALRSHLQSLGISLRSATEPTNVTLVSSKKSRHCVIDPSPS